MASAAATPPAETYHGSAVARAQQIAESHGCRVDVEDADGGGARFRLALVSSET
jgi:hypothetical protein